MEEKEKAAMNKWRQKRDENMEVREMDKKENLTTIQRKNEALMQAGEVSQEEFNYFTGMADVYGQETTKAAQRIVETLNGLTIEEANTALDLARYKIKRICKIQI